MVSTAFPPPAVARGEWGWEQPAAPSPTGQKLEMEAAEGCWLVLARCKSLCALRVFSLYFTGLDPKRKARAPGSRAGPTCWQRGC